VEHDKKNERTSLHYNCKRCEAYWFQQDGVSLETYWRGIGKQIQYIKIYCPSCRRTEELGW